MKTVIFVSTIMLGAVAAALLENTFHPHPAFHYAFGGAMMAVAVWFEEIYQERQAAEADTTEVNTATDGSLTVSVNGSTVKIDADGSITVNSRGDLNVSA